MLDHAWDIVGSKVKPLLVCRPDLAVSLESQFDISLLILVL